MKKALFAVALAGAVVAGSGARAQAPELASIELSHFMSAYSVADIEAVTKFYVDVLDFEVVKDVPLGEAMHFRWLRHGNQGIELVQMANSTPGPSRGTPRSGPGVELAIWTSSIPWLPCLSQRKCIASPSGTSFTTSKSSTST